MSFGSNIWPVSDADFNLGPIDHSGQQCMGALFDVGLSGWIGLPFGLGMILAGVISITSWMVRFQTIQKDESVVAESQTSILAHDASSKA